MGLINEDEDRPHASDDTVHANLFFIYIVNMFIYMVNRKGSSAMMVFEI